MQHPIGSSQQQGRHQQSHPFSDKGAKAQAEMPLLRLPDLRAQFWLRPVRIHISVGKAWRRDKGKLTCPPHGRTSGPQELLTL